MMKMKKIMCIITALATMLTISSVSVFAAEDMGEKSGDGQAVMSIEGDTEEVGGEDLEVQVENTAAPEQNVAVTQAPAPASEGITLGIKEVTPPQIVPAKPAVKAYSGYKAIKLKWDHVPNAEAYNIGMKDSKGQWRSLGVIRDNFIEIKKDADKKKIETRTKYTFRVMAVRLQETSKAKTKLGVGDINGRFANGGWTGEVSEPAYVKNKQCVNRLQISITLKSTRNYGGVKMKSGTRVVSEGYGGGRYQFKNPKGKTASVGRISVRNPKASYIKKGGWNYSKADAEYFINGYMKANKSAATKKKRMIWVSTYTQHLYIFEKKDGVWKATKWNWEVSMGTASTPSSTGNKTIKMIIGSRHGVPHWNVTSAGGGGYAALHGAKSSWVSKLGNLASHGCIRSKNENAKIIRNKCGKGTRVVIY